MAFQERRKVYDLSVIDLKSELEKRNMDNSGTKAALLQRLQDALEDEGEDPETFYFDVISIPGKDQLEDDKDDELTENGGSQTSVCNKSAVGNSVFSAGGGNNAGNKEHGPVTQVEEVGEGADQETPFAADNNFEEEENGVYGTVGNQGDINQSFREGTEDLHNKTGKAVSHSTVGSQNLTNTSSSARVGPGLSTTSATAKGQKNESSVVSDGGDEITFVVQEDDTMLNDIDADLLDGTHGEGKASDSASGDKKGDFESGQGSSTAVDASAISDENTDASKTTGIKDEKDTKTGAKSLVKSDKKDEKTSESSRNLWVSGLSSGTKAADLKVLFGKHGKVVAAKIVTNTKGPGSRSYYGFVTLGSADDTAKCIQHLNHTELHGKRISLERAKIESEGTKVKVLPPSDARSPTKSSVRSSSRRSDSRSVASRKDGEHHLRHHSKEKSGDLVSFSEIKAEQEQDRIRRREMFIEREKYKQRVVEKRQREEAFRIERERRRLREMREELQREKLETERLRLETERLHMEREQEKYRREQQRVLQERRPIKRRGPRDDEWGTKRPISERFSGGERYETHSERGPRDFNRRGEEHRTFREERPPRESRLRDDRRGPPRHDSRSEWKSERGGGSGAWNAPGEHSKMDEEWDAGDMGQGDGWDSEVVISQPAGSFAIQQGQMMTGGMGTGTLFIAQPAMQGTSVMMQGNMTRQNDGRFGMGGAGARRY